MEKKGVLGLAITIKDGKAESKLKTKGIDKFATIGLLVFQILNVYEDLKKETIKKGRY